MGFKRRHLKLASKSLQFCSRFLPKTFLFIIAKMQFLRKISSRFLAKTFLIIITKMQFLRKISSFITNRVRVRGRECCPNSLTVTLTPKTSVTDRVKCEAWCTHTLQTISGFNKCVHTNALPCRVTSGVANQITCIGC